MEIVPESRVLAVKGIRELNAASIRAFREAVGAAAKLGLPVIELDLSQVSSLDAFGLGVLAAMYRQVSARAPLGVAPVRLLNPQPAVQQMLELARMDLLFEIVRTRAQRAETEIVPPEDLLQAA
jgi:anti-anti-sigma factor